MTLFWFISPVTPICHSCLCQRADISWFLSPFSSLLLEQLLHHLLSSWSSLLLTHDTWSSSQEQKNIIIIIIIIIFDAVVFLILLYIAFNQLVFLSRCAGNVSAALSNNCYLSSLTPALKMLFDPANNIIISVMITYIKVEPWKRNFDRLATNISWIDNDLRWVCWHWQAVVDMQSVSTP